MDEQRLERFLLFAAIGLTPLILAVNVYDSGILKPSVLIACTTLLFAVTLAKVLQKGALEFSSTPISAPLIGYLAIVGLSASITGNQRSLEALMVIVSSAICLQFGMQLFNSKRRILDLFLVIASIVGLVCLIGLVQYFFNELLPIEFYLGPERRVGSTLGNSAFLGGYIALIFPMLLSQALSHEYDKRVRILLGLLLAALVFLLFVTQSRSSIIAFVISMALFALLTKRKKHIAALVIGAGVVSIIAIASSPSLIQRFESVFDTGASSTLARRWYFWDAGLRAFLDSPVLGHGVGNYESAMMPFRRPDYWVVKSEDIVPHAHNEIIETAVETGIPGILGFLLIFLGSLWAGFRTIRQADGWERLTAVGLLCGITGVLIDSMANVSMRQPPVMATAWLFAGLLVSSVLTHKTIPSFSFSMKKYKKLSWIPIAVWLVLIIPFLNAQTQKLKASSYLLKGLYAGISGRSAIAVGEYERAAALDSSNYLVLSGMTVELLKLQQPARALRVLESIEKRYPQYPRDALMESVALLSLNRLPEARSAIEEEISRRDHPEAFYIKSLICKNLADSAGERTALFSMVERSIAGNLQVELRYALLRLNTVSTSREEKENLRSLNERLLAAFPGDRMVAENLILVYRASGDSLRAASLSDSLLLSSAQ